MSSRQRRLSLVEPRTEIGLEYIKVVSKLVKGSVKVGSRREKIWHKLLL